MNLSSAEALPTESPPRPGRELPHGCEECGAPLDVQQRYCVRCGTRNRNAPSPAADYFSRSGRRGRATPASTAAAPRRRHWLAANAPALFLALLPLAVAAGVLIGKGGGSNDQQLIDALRSQRPAVAGAATAASPNSAAAGTAVAKKSRAAKGHAHKALSKTKFGTAHQVAGSKPSAQKVKNDTNLVKKLQNSTGKSYLQQQTQGLPDEVVVGGSGSGGGQNTGAGQP
ncbi:MAG TPA: hypothetical protein VGF74_09010 [Thermoleophilaceae bacterium]